MKKSDVHFYLEAYFDFVHSLKQRSMSFGKVKTFEDEVHAISDSDLAAHLYLFYISCCKDEENTPEKGELNSKQKELLKKILSRYDGAPENHPWPLACLKAVAGIYHFEYVRSFCDLTPRASFMEKYRLMYPEFTGEITIDDPEPAHG